ncbi:hypothetical protein [Knoellia subterranea]|uniref:SCP domain-containing protein n=1 Tax=Knoellia subterranea KCTC 19937 TaxID=1385521 RepID=A0A0A0JJK9_9MICO|nr:hypothetical protein [Knoellia subterranea]KGN37575.1 hypothetical protein N803_13700 [Knoellia subterranea KCTC 19937]
MMSRGSVLSTRLTRVAAPLLLATLALSACSDDEPSTASSPSTSTSTTDASSPSPSTSTTSASPTVTTTTSPSATSTPTTGGTAAPSQTSAPTKASCAAAGVAAPNTSGMSAAAAAKAKRIHAAAKACDAATLIALAKADQTGLAGEKPPNLVFTANAPQNYVALATLLTMQPTETFDGTIQPRVFSERYAEDDAEWDKVIKAGVVTRAAANQMRLNDGGYTGYRVGLASDGTWTFFTTGR